MNQAINPRLYRKATPNISRACPVATIGAKLVRAITAKNEAEQAALIAPKGTREATAAAWRHDTTQGRVHSLEDQVAWERAESLEGAAMAAAVGATFLELVKPFVPPEAMNDFQAVNRCLWSIRHAVEQVSGSALPAVVASRHMPERMNPYLALRDDFPEAPATGK